LQKNLQLVALSNVIFRNIFIFSTKNNIQTANVLELSAVRKFEKKVLKSAEISSTQISTNARTATPATPRDGGKVFLL
jgi:predicted secreted protein